MSKKITQMSKANRLDNRGGKREDTNNQNPNKTNFKYYD